MDQGDYWVEKKIKLVRVDTSTLREAKEPGSFAPLAPLPLTNVRHDIWQIL